MELSQRGSQHRRLKRGAHGGENPDCVLSQELKGEWSAPGIKPPSERRSQRELGDERVISPAAVGGCCVSAEADDSLWAKQDADVPLPN